MVRFSPTSFLGALWTAFATVSIAHSKVFHIPSALQNGTSVAQFTASSSGLDGLMVEPINGSAFDWWYFDVVSTDPSMLASVVVTFFASSQPAFPLLDPADTITVARIWVSYPNGTLWEATANGEQGATVTTDGDSSCGDWHGTGFSWTSNPYTREYVINIDAPAAGVKGTITFPSPAPAHYPCGPVSAGQNLEVGPHIGWANAVPDSSAVVNLEINGAGLAFTGTGYHDKNWSDQPFTKNVASWYWGHGRVGPYSIVWFDFLDRTGTEFVSAYASENGRILAASCAPGSISVRPTGVNATYPPVISSPVPTGYTITLPLENGEGTLAVQVNVLSHLISPNPEYARLIGNLSAELVQPPAVKGGKGKTATLTGMALFEQFKLTA
ncbi:hypothetical protein FB45DRAFT_939744 [Roridomyces roridus]|uniref:Hydroxyneurosporene synthase n=1 Tax=Roridomyces roridus TaxID=1738132 RepID=A0AAD7B809_9AGAR|nr:hypothetical protein FB45DRAFT_939744 [Roridomyces roridus]